MVQINDRTGSQHWFTDGKNNLGEALPALTSVHNSSFFQLLGNGDEVGAHQKHGKRNPEGHIGQYQRGTGIVKLYGLQNLVQRNQGYLLGQGHAA